MKIHRQQCIFPTLRYNKDRERECRESDGTVLHFHGGHELRTVGALVVDVEELPVTELVVGNGHHHVFAVGGLPLAVAVEDGNIVCAIHLLAFFGGAGHGRGAHGGACGHLAGNGNGEVPSISGLNVPARRDLSRIRVRGRIVNVSSSRQYNLFLTHGTEPRAKDQQHHAQKTTDFLKFYRVEFLHNMFYFLLFSI